MTDPTGGSAARTSWTHEQLDLLAGTDVLEISSTRADGSFSPWWPIWVVVVGGEVFVRSTDGPDKVWFRNALRRGSGRIRADATVIAVVFEDDRERPQGAIAEAYLSKYRASSPWSLRRASTSTSTIRLSPAP